jgi:hypothetical protein
VRGAQRGGAGLLLRYRSAWGRRWVPEPPGRSPHEHGALERARRAIPPVPMCVLAALGRAHSWRHPLRQTRTHICTAPNARRLLFAAAPWSQSVPPARRAAHIAGVVLLILHGAIGRVAVPARQLRAQGDAALLVALAGAEARLPGPGVLLHDPGGLQREEEAACGVAALKKVAQHARRAVAAYLRGCRAVPGGGGAREGEVGALLQARCGFDRSSCLALPQASPSKLGGAQPYAAVITLLNAAGLNPARVAAAEVEGASAAASAKSRRGSAGGRWAWRGWGAGGPGTAPTPCAAQTLQAAGLPPARQTGGAASCSSMGDRRWECLALRGIIKSGLLHDG